MSGPCSYPAGNKAEWERLNENVCDLHHGITLGRRNDGSLIKATCKPGNVFVRKNKKGEAVELEHDFITLRMWLAKRNKLRTGKTN